MGETRYEAAKFMSLVCKIFACNFDWDQDDTEPHSMATEYRWIKVAAKGDGQVQAVHLLGMPTAHMARPPKLKGQTHSRPNQGWRHSGCRCCGQPTQGGALALTTLALTTCGLNNLEVTSAASAL